MINAAYDSDLSERSNNRVIGYARVSRHEQNLHMQLDALEKAGCDVIYQEKGSAIKDLPEQKQALKALRSGDVLAVWAIDRLGRTTLELLKLMDWLNANDIALQIITSNIDTRTPQGKLLFVLNSALAENERTRLVERTRHGLQAARARGRMGGRPRALTDAQKREIKALLDHDALTPKEIMERYQISRSTFYREFPAPQVEGGDS